jgi:PDZ domain
MISPAQSRGRLRRVALVTGLAAWVISALPCKADAGAPAGAGLCPMCHKPHQGHHKHPGPGMGTLGYGPPGLYPGFQGFGLGYHLGYGYGGDALGVGAEGGYPFYGGPGYPHPWPRLRRFGRITPFPFYSGPGGPTPECPNYYGPVGPLFAGPSVVDAGREPGQADDADGYGAFTGALPYPEMALAPFITAAAAGGSSRGVSSASSPNAPPNPTPASGETLDEHAATRTLGADAEAVVDPGRGRGLKITRVYAGSVAERAGLRIGDLIHSINGYPTELLSSLAWIIANAAPDRVLKMSVRTASDGKVHSITAKVP